MSFPLEIVAAGLETVLGSGCEATAMLVRVARFSPRRARLFDFLPEPVRMGTVEDLPDDLFGFERLVALAVPALTEATAGAAAALGTDAPLPVWLALPEAWRSDDDPRMAGEVIDWLTRASSVKIDLARSGVVRSGRAGGAEAVARAAALWTAGGGEGPAAVLVGGVDSVYHPEVIPELERRRGEGVGEAPAWSEGAAFVALAPPGSRLPARGPRVRCTGALVWRPEPAAPLDEVDFVAARVDLLRRVLGASRPGWALTDVDRDPARALEWWDVASEAGLGDAVHDHLSGRIGDVGAAMGPASMAVAWAFWRAGCGRAPSAVISLASDDGACGAIGLDAEEAAR